MKLAEKLVYPLILPSGGFKYADGITYKEALVLALASNPTIVQHFNIGDDMDKREFGELNAKRINMQADAIIKQMQDE